MSNIRKISYDECLALYNKLREMGYPVQIYYASDKWKVLVEGIITNSSSKIDPHTI